MLLLVIAVTRPELLVRSIGVIKIDYYKFM